MRKDATVRARVSAKLKGEAENVLHQLGLSMSDAITLFLAQVKLRKGLPFTVDIPNKETLRAIKEARAGIGVKRYDSVDEIFKEIDADATGKHKE